MDTTFIVSNNIDTLNISNTLKILDVTPPISAINYLLEPSTIIALTAICISVASLIATAYYNRKSIQLTKAHNELSVKPLFNIETLTINKHFHIRLVNSGIGPGVIEYVKYTYKNITYELLFDVINVKRTEKYTNLKVIKENDHNAIISNGAVLGANCRFNLFNTDDEIGNQLDIYNVFFKDVRIIVCYNDIYNNKYTYNNKIISDKIVK